MLELIQEQELLEDDIDDVVMEINDLIEKKQIYIDRHNQIATELKEMDDKELEQNFYQGRGC